MKDGWVVMPIFFPVCRWINVLLFPGVICRVVHFNRSFLVICQPITIKGWKSYIIIVYVCINASSINMF